MLSYTILIYKEEVADWSNQPQDWDNSLPLDYIFSQINPLYNILYSVSTQHKYGDIGWAKSRYTVYS